MKLFEVKLTADRVDYQGLLRIVKEEYIVNALSFTEAETKAIKEAGPLNSITAIKPIKVCDLFLSKDDQEQPFFGVKISFITLDENTAKERRTKEKIITQNKDITAAKKYVEEMMNDTLCTWCMDEIKELKYVAYID